MTNPTENQYTSTSRMKSPKELNHHPHYYRIDQRKTKSTITVRQGMGAVILVYVDQNDYLNHPNSWLACHIPKFKITLNIFAGPTRKKTAQAEIDEDG